jgi:hypothetical protein
VANVGPAVLQPLLGWLLTAFAITLGAPFWFDILNKFIVIRSTVKPHEKSPEEGSEDRKGASGGGTKHVQLAGVATAGGAATTPSSGSPPQGSSTRAPTDATGLDGPPAGEEELVDAAIGGPADAADDADAREGGTGMGALFVAAKSAAAAAPRIFDTASRKKYVESVLNDTDRFDFLRPARQDWIEGNWWHSFEKDGKTFRVAAGWGDTKAGRLTIVRGTKAGSAFSSGKATFCNFNVSYCFHEAYGGPCLQFMDGKEHSANDLIDLLSTRWKNLTPAQAAQIANEGGFVIAGKKATGHGHVVFLLEDSDPGGNPAKINTFHVGGGLPRKRTVADIWGSLEGVHFVTPPDTFSAFQPAPGQ